MLRELGISMGTLIFCLVTGYFVIKWAVKNAIVEAHYEITGEKSESWMEVERMMDEDEKKRQEAREDIEARRQARRAARAERKAAKEASEQ
ncbi:MAG: hypothetical protein J5379_06410 [Clostridiales bacterium]|nr:hypothetical protein [Clostridiales bacterium]